MSDPKDPSDLEQGMPGIPGSGQIGADVEDEDIRSLLQNHADENSQFQTEVDFHNNSGFVGNPLERGSAEQNIKETAIPSELQPGAEVPVFTNQTENGSEEPGAEVPVSMDQTDNGSEKPGEEVAASMNQTENNSEKTDDEVPAFMNQTENDSERDDDHVPAFMNQTEDDFEKPGDQVPAFVNQTDNDSEKTVDQVPAFMNQTESDSEQNGALDVKTNMESEMMNTHIENGSNSLESDVKMAHLEDNRIIQTPLKQERAEGEQPAPTEGPKQSFAFDNYLDGGDSGTEEEQAAFIKELENFFRVRGLEFKPPKFYGEGLNCLKLWRAVTKLGGYDRVTSCKLWRQVGESFKPPKTCTTVSWSFRGFYEKALLEYEKHKIRTGELQIPLSDLPEAMVIENQGGGNQASGSGRARRDAAARAMQGWHSQRMLGNGEVGDPIIKGKSSDSLPKQDKHLKSGLKRKRPSTLEPAVKVARMKDIQPQLNVYRAANEQADNIARAGLGDKILLDLRGECVHVLSLRVVDNMLVIFLIDAYRGDTAVVDVGAPADWVKINVRQTKDCFEVYALVPGLLREEVQVQSDPAGRLIISGEPEQPDNPWGVTPFKKVITLPSRIDPYQTSAVVTLHGQLFVRAPFDQSDL